MKTLADFKKAIRVGSKWKVYNHFNNEDRGIREISIVQTKKYAFKTIGKDGSEVDSWADFPLAKDIVFEKDGTIKIFGRVFFDRKLFYNYEQVTQ